MHTQATAAELTPASTFAALAAFINQRPGLDPANYDRRGYAMDSRRITKDKQRANNALAVAQAYPFNAQAMIDAQRAFSGRLSIIRIEGKGTAVDYCTGQYFCTEYRAAAAAVLESYIEAVKPKELPNPSASFETIADVKAAHAASGGHWFSRDNMRFARSRVYPGIYRGQRLIWFVSSEKSGFSDDSPRRFSVRVFDPVNARVSTPASAEGFGKYYDLADARDHAKALARDDKAGKHTLRPKDEANSACPYCGHYGESCTGNR